jgi:bacterioferritin-associated ferredoxin
MYVCVCQAVSDHQIRSAVCQGACSMRDLCEQLGVATRCGRCREFAQSVLDETLSQRAPRPVADAA